MSGCISQRCSNALSECCNGRKDCICSKSCCDVFAKVFYFILSVLRSFSLVVFYRLDQKCAILEKASIINCTQEFLVPHPQHWVLVWIVSSIVSSFLLILILWLNQDQLNYNFASLKMLWRKGSFWSLNVLFVLTLVYYIIRIVEFAGSDEMKAAVSISVLFWSPVTLFVVYCLNYLKKVPWPSKGNKNIRTISIWLVYWVTLIIYFAENTCMVLSVTIDAFLSIVPLEREKYKDPDVHDQIHTLVLILLGMKVAFKTRLLYFFWNKIFHANWDLFSEPNVKLDDVYVVNSNHEEMELSADTAPLLGNVSNV